MVIPNMPHFLNIVPLKTQCLCCKQHSIMFYIFSVCSFNSYILEEIKLRGYKTLITPNSWHSYLSRVKNFQLTAWAEIIAAICYSGPQALLSKSSSNSMDITCHLYSLFSCWCGGVAWQQCWKRSITAFSVCV